MTESHGVIPCSEAVRQLWDYLDQAVSPEDQASVEQHLSFCRRCCGELEFATQLRGLLASQSAEELPPHVKARLERFLADLEEDRWRVI
jgi:mycothiol system anti-sigma-R factor